MPRPRVAAVSFLNAKPLLHGLDAHVDLYLDVPSRLLSGLAAAHFDVALLPVADVPQLPGAHIITWPTPPHPPHPPLTTNNSQLTTPPPQLSSGGIACDGPTLTVRIFSDRPLDRLTTLLCDTDSHTSVQLARVILAERFGVHPTFQPLPRDRPYTGDAGPCLLIGDKVITDPPDPRLLPLQHDLGHEWKLLTGLPFVFAAWTARPGYDATEVIPHLRQALAAGLAAAPELARTHAPKHHWPEDIALRYFTEYLRYALTPRELSAVSLFWEKAGLS